MKQNRVLFTSIDGFIGSNILENIPTADQVFILLRDNK